MIPVNIDPLKLEKILNKSPGKVITAEEWNEILNLLVSQGNYLSDSYKSIYDAVQDILNGKVEGIVIETDVTSFGGRPPEDYALKTDLTISTETLQAYIDLALRDKQNLINLTANRVVYTSPQGTLWASSITGPELSYLSGAKSNIQNQITSKLDKSSKAVDSAKVNGKCIFIQQSQPNATQTGDVWIGW